MHLTLTQSAFLAINAALGALIGYASATAAAFAALPVPLFAWLVLGVLVSDLVTGALAGAHPAAVISMPVRIAALALSFLASLASSTLFAAH